ncbi:MAG: virulence RhuM family protein [Rhizobiaceae bacterium]|nr:virulence RhuM family protein [Rhizobiaceae bacterium]
MTVEPVHLLEDSETGNRFLVYDGPSGPRLDIRFQGNALWMTQEQIARLFGRDVSVISRHIANVLKEGELDEASSLQKMQTTLGRPATLYSLDMVISVGYRVSSAQATLFRRWATGVLVQFAKSGFVVDSVRLKEERNSDRIAELREIIRDIRSDEANVYRELKRICSLCQDYDSASKSAQSFFQQTQAKLVYAVVSQTPAEIIRSRADHTAPNMGLRTWPNENIRKQDVSTSKNYLAEAAKALRPRKG